MSLRTPAARAIGFRHSAAVALVCSAALVASRPSASAEIERGASFREATMAFDGARLTVDTGAVAREWDLTRDGLRTVRWALDDREAVGGGRPVSGCDWDLGCVGPARLVALSARRDDDERFTDEHLRVVADFEYPEDQLRVRYVVWAYPGATGLRTQLHVRALPGFEKAARDLLPGVVETVSFDPLRSEVRAFGLMQGIKTTMNQCILREEVVAAPWGEIAWANGLVVDGGEGGLVVVKESNKHTRLAPRADIETGGFTIDDAGASVTGVGLRPADLREDAYRACWATWTVLHRGGDDAAQLALKRFDRRRYPVDPERDVYTMANTWGSEDARPPCLHAAREENVLREIESVADLGIDVLQIDDGWQTPRWTTAASASEVQRGSGALQAFGDYPVYPDGWTRVTARAEELGVELGLWAAWTAPLDALRANYDAAGFTHFKLDFAHLDTKDKFEGLAQKARDLIKHTGHAAGVNWDVTETAARMGYFSGREYGNVYLANRKTSTVRNEVLYVPHKVLGDAWNLSKYVNLNKFQVTVQNVDRVHEGAPTDAAEHPHEYAVGIALMGSPIFFQETRHYEPAARRTVREILATYKKHRRAMYAGYVFPIGDPPDNHGWTGFQNHDPTTGAGYLTIFRERLNRETTRDFELRLIENTNLRVTDLLSGESKTRWVGPAGRIAFETPEAPGFLFLRYEAAPEPVVTKRANPNRG